MQTNEKTGATYTTQMDAARKGIITGNQNYLGF